MSRGLIGCTGFVGTTLLAQTNFDALFRSSNINDIKDRSFDLLVCAGAPAAKWKANQSPREDWENLDRLMNSLATVTATRAILISTVDVYPIPVGVDEATPVDVERSTPYGRHRYHLEQFFARQFPNALCVRLPALFGAGLRKNFVYDLIRKPEALALTHYESVFQFYNMNDLWGDIERAGSSNWTLMNFATEPITAADVARLCFGVNFTNVTPAPPVIYDVRTRYSAVWGGETGYMRSRSDVLHALAAFARSEGLSR